MKILAIGDIFGKTGRQVIKNFLPELKKKHQIDLVIANVENATHGKGISKAHYEELEKYGIDVMTSGNHVFDLEETQKNIDKFSNLIRPLNSNPYHGGKGSIIIDCKNKKIRITNLIGQVFMPPAENPYFALEKILVEDDSDIHLVDFHAESTAEKIVFAYYFDDKFPRKITALWGTHTHVQTADERTLLNGTAFITDLGMTGPSEGIIGAKYEVIIRRAKDGLPTKMVPHEDHGQFNGVIFELDDITSKIVRVERINEVF